MGTAPPKELCVAPFHRLEARLGPILRRMEAGDPLRPRRVLVISNLVRDRLQERLARGGAFAGVDFLTPRDLAEAIGGPGLRRAGRRPLPRGGGAALAARLLRGNRGRLRRLRPPEGVPGYDEALAATLADLREAGLGPADLQRMGGDPFRDLALLLDRYEGLLASLGLYDEPALLRAACEAAEASPPDVPAVLYGFADLNSLQRRLIGLCCRAAPAAALVPAEEEAPACAFARPLIAWLRAQGFAGQQAAEGAARPFAAAGRALFGGEGAAALPEGALRVVSAPTASREAFELLRETLHSPGRDAAVLLPGGESYLPLFEETCRSLGVEARAEHRAPLARTPAGRALLRMLALPGRGYPREELLRFLDEGRFADSPRFAGWRAASGGEGDPLLPARWEFLSRRLPHADGEGGWRRAIGRAKEAKIPLHGFEAALDILFAELRALPAAGPPSLHAGAASRALAALTGEVEEKAGVRAALEELAGLDPLLGEVGGAEFQRWARLALERPRAGGPARPARVRLLSLQGARGLSFGTVVIPGLAEGIFPVRGREDPLLPDARRAELNRALGEGEGRPPLLPLKGERMEEDRYLFWLALQSAERRVILGVPRAGGAEGGEKPPSLFLHHLGAAVGIPEEGGDGLPRFGAGILRAATPGLDAESLRGQPVSLLEGDLGAIAGLLRRKPVERGALAHLGAAPGFARRRSALDDRWRPGVLTAQDGLLAGRDVLEVLRGALGRPVPVTGVESFFGCPYRFALEHMVGLAHFPGPHPPFEADGMLRGRLFHAALQNFFRDLQAKGGGVGDLAEGGRRRAVVRAVEAAFRRAEEEGEGLLPLGWRLLRASVERQLEGFLQGAYGGDDRGWRPLAAEGPFGRGGVPPVEFAGEGGRLLVSGRYDLLERSADGEYRFVDFKSGRSAPRKKDPLEGGRWLQPHLYARHGQGALGPGARIGAAYAFVTEGMGFRLSPVPPEQVEALRPRVDRLLAHFLRAAGEGAFFPLPSPACAYCGFVTICGPERGPRAARKAEAPARAALRAAQGPAGDEEAGEDVP